MSTENQTKQGQPKFKSAGTAEKFTPPVKLGGEANNENDNEGNEGAGAGAGAGGGNEGGGNEGGEGQQQQQQQQTSELNEEQLRAGYEQLTGEKYEGSIEDLKKTLKEKLKPAPAVETDDEKQAKVKAREKRLLDKFLSNDGTIEQFTALKSLANADVKEISINELKRELKEEGKFTDDKIDDIINDMFFQIADDELEKYTDETEKEFLKRKKEYGAQLLANRSKALKDKAVNILSNLESEIDAEDLSAQQEAQLSSTVEEHFKTLPRKLTFELGKSDDRQLDPIAYDVADADIQEVENELKDPAKRKQLLFNEDGSLNVANIADMRVKIKVLESLLKTTYLAGEKKQVEFFESRFGTNPHMIGVGGAGKGAGQNNGSKTNGKATGFGKAVRTNVNLQK